MQITCRGKNYNSKHPIILFICMMMNYLNLFVLCQTNVFYLVRLCGLLIFKFAAGFTGFKAPKDSSLKRFAEHLQLYHHNRGDACQKFLWCNAGQSRNSHECFTWAGISLGFAFSIKLTLSLEIILIWFGELAGGFSIFYLLSSSHGFVNLSRD